VAGTKRVYSTTPKVKVNGRTFMTWPHLVITGIVGLSWLVGVLGGLEHPYFVKVAALLTIVPSVIAMWTETWAVPEPFDAALADQMPRSLPPPAPVVSAP
jgi:hypothetical protein